MASTHIQQCQISELLRDGSEKKRQMSQRQASLRIEAALMEAQVRERKEKAAISMRSPLIADLSTWLPEAQAGNRFVTTAVRELPEECTELDGGVHVLTNMSIMGQLCQSQSEGGIRSVWILASAAGVVTERVNLKSPAPKLQAQSSVQPGNMRLFYTYSDSAFWKKKFLHRSLTRDLQAYSGWHREQAGNSPMKRLSSITLLGSPVPMVDLGRAVAPVASAVAADQLATELSFFRCQDLAVKLQISYGCQHWCGGDSDGTVAEIVSTLDLCRHVASKLQGESPRKVSATFWYAVLRNGVFWLRGRMITILC